ncbi:GIY-YIG nuclease family protein [Xanthomonas sp. 4461]|uniref:GIY-YIG nuclease family protein n=1 Tax=Xanthomonas sp. 4461 TaxID=3035313 RepID=UPI002168CE9A|nr:GIY-YIG nuclease family protein [Xanthomonas sp. 4461]MCS3807768.1 hypothetical protein [Xanthomonas sp. 4461]
MSEQYLYLLPNKEGTAFKIGVAFHPMIRSTRLPQAIDHEKSFQVPMTSGSALKVEKVLHILFKDNSFPMPHGAGYTEWFAIEALDDVLKFLEDQRSRLGVGAPERIPVRIERPTQTKAQDYSLDERRQLRREAAEQRFFKRRELAIEINREAIQVFKKVIGEWVEEDAIIGTLIDTNSERSHAYIYLESNSEKASAWAHTLISNGLIIEGRKSSGQVNFCTGVFHEPKMGLSELNFSADMFTPCDFSEDDIPGLEDLRRLVDLHLPVASGDSRDTLLKIRGNFKILREKFREEFWEEWRKGSGGVW